MKKEVTENNPCIIYDLVEYKLKKYIDSFTCGTPEWDVAMNLMLLYLDEEINVKWCSEGLIISPTNQEVPENTELLIPDISKF